MPPKKEAKEKQVKGDEAEELILQYLKSVNRPYASTDVSANLKNAVPKAAAQKVLQTLADRGDLTVKQYNKQTIFVYNQENLPIPSPEELAELDGAHKVTADEVKERKEELRALEKEMSSTAALPKTKDLPLEVEKVTKENALTVSALEPYRKTDSGEAPVEPLTAEEIKVIDLEFVRWHKEWKARKGVYKQIQDHALDMTHQKADEFMDDQGIYPDDEEALEVFSGEFTKPAARPVVPSKRPNTATLSGATQAPSKIAKASAPVPAKAASTANHKPAPSVAAKTKATTTTTTSKKRAASKGKGDTLQVEVEDDNADNDASQVSAHSQPQQSQATATSQESSAMMQSSSDESASFEEPPKKNGRRG